MNKRKVLECCGACNGSGFACTHCAGTGIHPKHLHAEKSEQFGTNCVVVESLEADPEETIQWAKEIEATYHYGVLCYVIDFQFDDPRVGHELFTEKALRHSMRPKTL